MPEMPVVFDATYAAYSTSVTHVIGNHSYRILLLGVNTQGDTDYGAPTVTDAAYNGVAMTLYKDLSYSACGGGRHAGAYWYYLLAPAVGSHTVTLSGSWPYGSTCFVMSTSYYDVFQDNPWKGTCVSQACAGTLSVPNDENDLVVDFIAQISVGNGSDVSVGAGQTERNNYSAAGPGASLGAACSDELGTGANATMSWSGGAGLCYFAGALHPLPPRSPISNLMSIRGNMATLAGARRQSISGY